MRKAILCFLNSEDKLLLLQTDYGNKVVWNGVSGYVDPGETSTEAAVREIMEEIGVRAEGTDLHSIGHYDIFEIFVLNKWQGEPAPKEASIKEVRWFSKDHLPWSEMHTDNDKWLPSFVDLI